ncbi:hypothetical protein CLU79DRAFT_780720 [Phycomyces nitens]|nr:hypothetical protein CLU79DRAFT_780720 [Phycomyces nitens]
MITPKATPVVKSTSVTVHNDDPHPTPTAHATLVLTQLTHAPQTAPQPTRSWSLQSHSSLLQRLAHPTPKAIAASLPTSVVVGGNMSIHNEPLAATPSVVELLSRQSEQEKNRASSLNIPSTDRDKKECSSVLNSQTLPIPINPTPPVDVRKPQSLKDIDTATITSVRSKWSWFGLSESAESDLPLLSQKRSSASLASSIKSTTKPKKKNVVLPSFQSQFIPIPEAPPPPPPSLFHTTLDAFQNFFNPKITETIDPKGWRRRVHARFAQFMSELKEDPAGVAEKKVVVIGVHGWFPMKLVRSMVGEPTGTSTRFCEQMSTAAKLYFQAEHNVQLPDSAITCVPLEGEGKVEDRVNKLYGSLLANSVWLDAVSSADVILWATHSQGTPVSVMLLQRLLERGHIHVHRQSVCLLAMAGISHGPFPALKGSLIVKYFEADPARELFEFMDSNSSISQKFREAQAHVLKSGIKMVLVGSMQDQVVPLYSAIMSATTHPNILRSVYIDGHIYSDDDFIIHLVSFALKLRNAGLSDHGLLTHVSEVLAGNIYALEGGHSTIYEELDVYTMSLRYLFETKPFGKLSLAKKAAGDNGDTPDLLEQDPRLDSFQAKVQWNPFYLPWAMRGICDDAQITSDPELHQELLQLVQSLSKWNPPSSKMREVKYRLEPLQAFI